MISCPHCNVTMRHNIYIVFRQLWCPIHNNIWCHVQNVMLPSVWPSFCWKGRAQIGNWNTDSLVIKLYSIRIRWPIIVTYANENKWFSQCCIWLSNTNFHFHLLSPVIQCRWFNITCFSRLFWSSHVGLCLNDLDTEVRHACSEEVLSATCRVYGASIVCSCQVPVSSHTYQL